MIRFTAETRGGPVRILGGFMPWNLRGEYVNSLPGSLTSLTHPANAGDTVLVLEAMKMEIPVVAPENGKIASFQVSVGDSVESGDILATLS